MAKIGSQKFIGKRVLFDKYIGLGVRVNHNKVTHWREKLPEPMAPPIDTDRSVSIGGIEF